MEEIEITVETAYTLADVVNLLQQSNLYLSYIVGALLVLLGVSGVVLIAKIVWYFLFTHIC